ncbi:hypothetical protein Csa_012608 [Cucumis sativus]|uniref:Uncharacterized protein n=1 Tax=Cucumis sativus TaxID=3659 RepID=A0A0A0L3B3_CUCSA|nr:hypothetical protein Csa_012608 [Cucumis sativus]
MAKAIIVMIKFFFVCFITVIILLPFLSFGSAPPPPPPPSSSPPSGFMESAKDALMASLQRRGGKPFQVQRTSPGGPDQHHH